MFSKKVHEGLTTGTFPLVEVVWEDAFRNSQVSEDISETRCLVHTIAYLLWDDSTISLFSEYVQFVNSGVTEEAETSLKSFLRLPKSLIRSISYLERKNTRTFDHVTLVVEDERPVEEPKEGL